jgi:predicted porin
MKARYLAPAILAALPHLAYAQAGVTISGMVDLGLVHESGGAAGSTTKVTSGVEKGSRLVFRGSEDLGGGASAIFLLESGFQSDTGTLGQGGLLFGRQAYLGLASRTGGTLTLGRQYTPNYAIMATVGDPFAAGLAGVFSSVFANSAGRMNNTVRYLTPRLRGWNAEFAYGAGESAGSTRTGSSGGAALWYTTERLNARLGYHYRNNDSATVQGRSPARNLLLAMNYDFIRVRAYLAYGVNTGPNSSQLPAANAYGAAVAPVASTDSRDLLLGATVPLGRGKLIASAIHKDDRGLANQDASLYALGYVYFLSRRTDLYVSYGYIDNHNGAGYTVNSAIDIGTGNRAFNLGMRHTF